MTTKNKRTISQLISRRPEGPNKKISRSMIGLAFGLGFALASCGTQDGLDVPDSLAMVDESTTTVLAEPEAPVADEPASEEPATDEPAAAAAPEADPMTAPEEPAEDAPADSANPPATAPPVSNPPATDPPATSDPATDPPAGDEMAQAEAESFRLLNELRASVGLSALSRAADMDSFARNWSQTMATTGNFEHSTGPYGENIAWNSQGSLTPAEAAAAMHEMWVNSPGHYANMTSPDYKLAGMGFYKDSSGWHATHVFER